MTSNADTNYPSLTRFTPAIQLTVHPEGQGMVTVTASQLITYAEGAGFTRLRLTGRQVLNVRETTDEIDRLIRAANQRPGLS